MNAIIQPAIISRKSSQNRKNTSSFDFLSGPKDNINSGKKIIPEQKNKVLNNSNVFNMDNLLGFTYKTFERP